MPPKEQHFTKSLAISWAEIHKDAKSLGKKLKAKGNWDRIIAITRGGLIPAAIISRMLEIRNIDTVCLMSYDGQSQGEIKVMKAAESDDDGENTLIIDDLVDTGETAKLVKEMLPKAHLAVLYAKPGGRDQADTYLTDIPGETWIYFPWELEPKNPQS